MKDDLPHQDGRDKRSKGGNAARILDAIKCCPYGEHNMIVYPDTTTLNEVIADHYKEALQERNELVLVIPYYQTVGRVREVLEKNDIDVAKYEHEGSLVIYDSVKGYQGPEGPFAAVSLVNLLAERAKKLGKNGTFVMSDLGSFFLYERIQGMISYELSLPPTWDGETKLRSFCLYHQGDYSRLSERDQKALADHHHTFIKS